MSNLGPAPLGATGVCPVCYHGSDNEMIPEFQATIGELKAEGTWSESPESPAMGAPDERLRELAPGDRCRECGASDAIGHYARCSQSSAQRVPAPPRNETVERLKDELAEALLMHRAALDRLDSVLVERDALKVRAETANRVHLARHTRLSEAVGIDPGYSADATIDKAIEILAECTALRASLEEEKARLDWLEAQLLGESLHGDVTLSLSLDPRRVNIYLGQSIVPVACGESLGEAIGAMREELAASSEKREP